MKTAIIYVLRDPITGQIRYVGNNTSGFVGVYRGDRNDWRAEFRFRGRHFRLGRFKKIEDAVFARALAVATQ